MTGKLRPTLALLSALLLAPLLAAAAHATSYMMTPDEALVDGAEVIAQVTVESVEPAPIAGPPSTDYFVQIERLLKGYVTGSTVVVRVPGGIGPDGVGLQLWGAPEFRQGERVLLFLAPRADGTYGVLHLMLGAFFEIESGGSRLAVRSLGESLELAGDGSPAARPMGEPGRDFAGFLNWITDRATGLNRPIDYYVDPLPGSPRPMRATGPLLEDVCTQLNFRWFEFDRGGGVKWSVSADGFDGRGAGRSALMRARRLWNRESGGALKLENGGSRAGGEGLSSHDGLNQLLFNDPDEEIAGRFSCSRGGIVALTGIWFESGRGQACDRVGAGRKGAHEGRQFLAIVEADVVTNDGSECLLASDALLTARLFAHELGHSLGLSHLADPDALMSGPVADSAHPDSLRPADREAISGLYRVVPRP